MSVWSMNGSATPRRAEESVVSECPRVLIFRTSMLPLSETFILAQARALKDFRPRLAAVYPSGTSLIAREEATFVTTSGLAKGKLARRWYWKTGYAPRFHRQLKTLAPSLIHAHFAPDGVTALHIQDALSIPLVVTLHGYDVTISDDYFAGNPEGRRYLARRRELWRRASAFICVSEFIKRQAVKIGFPEDKLRVLYTGIDLGLFRTSDAPRDKKLILFAGRLVEKKGAFDLIRAVERVRESGTEARVLLLGDGPLRAQLEAYVREHNLPCEFLGMQPPEKVRDHLRRARIFCVPSKTAEDGDSEGLGMVFAEAQAVGTPVVSYDHGGIPEVVKDGVTGLLASEGDVEGLAAALSRYLRDDDLWQASSSAGPLLIREAFCLARQARKLEDLYLSTCEQDRSTPCGRENGA
jgi:colanic acid/amylovoran biosynthesis glycosyltransferase